MASVTVTSTTTTTKVTPSIRFEPSYIKTIPGILKVAQIVLSLLGFICSQVPPKYRYESLAGWYAFVSMTAFWVTLLLLVFYLFHIIERLHFIPWLAGEFGYCALWAVLYFIAAVVVATKAAYEDALGAATFFGFAAMGVYAYDAYIKFRGWRSGGIAQGERTTATSSTTAAASQSYPAY